MPLFAHAMQDHLGALPPQWQLSSIGALHAAQMRHSRLADTAIEVVDLCNALGVPATLLKGISVSEQFYPAAHLRPMGDIDVLIPREHYEAVASAMLDLGYRHKQNAVVDSNWNHGPPLFHPSHQVWVELHTRLFPLQSPLQQGELFGATSVMARSVASEFRGHPARRLSVELQLVYTACFWVRDLCHEAMHPSHLPPLFDLVYLLRRSAGSFDWDRMLSWLDNDLARAHVFLTLGYLHRHALAPVPVHVLATLSEQDVVGRFEMRILHAMLDRYLLTGKPFRAFSSWHLWSALLRAAPPARKLLSLPARILFPPARPDRFTTRYHVQRFRRVVSRLR